MGTLTFLCVFFIIFLVTYKIVGYLYGKDNYSNI